MDLSHPGHLSGQTSNFNSQDLEPLTEISKHDSAATDNSASLLDNGVTLLGMGNNQSCDFVNPNLNSLGTFIPPSKALFPAPLEVHDVTPNGDDEKDIQQVIIEDVAAEFTDKLAPQSSDPSHPSKAMLNVPHRPITPFNGMSGVAPMISSNSIPSNSSSKAFNFNNHESNSNSM